ncbi:MAG TPA: KpsF/GutQ family sugar-phosphate isomerase [Desulfomonilaceae bacterium]|nr:KpsF/GutQ family sugar-phosphate isomerase [Desulfomonilaceae bacterium]
MQSPETCSLNGRALEIARQVLEIEIQGIRATMERLDHRFEKCVDMLYSLRGRIIITGVGKSGIIGRKIAATLTSTGSPAIFVHPVDGLHGDVGIVSRDDALVALSNSGETAEITSLVATIKKRGSLVVGITGAPSSTLARMSDLVLDCRVPREACPLNMAPTASTTAALSLGDALAIALMVRRGFRKEDFLRHHPAGSLGERLSLKVRDIMLNRPSIPEVDENAPLDVIIKSINAQNLGFTLVTAEDRLLGIITDGDLRRALENGTGIYDSCSQDLMTRNPLTIREDRTAAEALEIMERKLITALAVVYENGNLAGIIHLHDLLGRGDVHLAP